MHDFGSLQTTLNKTLFTLSKNTNTKLQENETNCLRSQSPILYNSHLRQFPVNWRIILSLRASGRDCLFI